MRARRALPALLGAALAAGATVLPARPAAADPARPGNVRSEVTAVVPAAPVTARVVGGDAFLEVRVERGHELVVLDYTDGDYVRFAPDGQVFENRASPAWILNRTRYADGAETERARGDTPDWHRVAGDGVYAWHDHRAHWMSPTVAPAVAWSVAVRIDGRAGEIVGRYGPVDPPAGWPWWLLAVAAAVAVGLAAAARPWLGSVGALAASVATLPVAHRLTRLPAGSWTTAALVVAAGVAATASLARPGPLRSALQAGAGVALALWGVRRVAVFDHAVLVTSLPPWIDRASVALALGVGVGVAVAAVRHVLRVPSAGAPTTEGVTA